MLRSTASTNCFIALAVAGAFACCSSAPAQIKGAKTAPPFDAAALVKSLASENSPPDIESFGFINPAKFDWSEQDRTWGVMQKLMDRAEEAWPELVKHLDDERYCVTIEVFNGAIHNWSVGLVCREIIERNLSDAYYPNLKPESLRLYQKLRSPRFDIELKEWCEARSKQKLYELQIESCEWAVKELAKDDAPTSGDVRKKWIASIEDVVSTLKKSKTPIATEGFGFEEIVPVEKPPDKVEDPFGDPAPAPKTKVK